MNVNNQPNASYSYDPYGNPLGSSGPMADFNHYGFSSKEIHPGSGTYSYGYRFYDPNLQRWLNRDPIGIAGRINAYGFGGNSPETYVDTDGRFLLPTALIGAGLGAIGNGIYAYINDHDIGQAMLRGALIGGIAGTTAGIGMEAALAAAGVYPPRQTLYRIATRRVW